jgi:hypothetical protein
VASPALRWSALVLFFGYAGLLALAGGWGAVGARVDMPLLLDVDLDDLSASGEANLLAQYRFLRVVELGFGLAALVYWRRIFARGAFNAWFLAIMGAGVAARLLSLVVDGVPSAAMLAFLAWELVGVVVIFAYTRAPG